LPSADEPAQHYSVVSEQPLTDWNFYMALGYFKAAIIAAGIDYRRRSSGSHGASTRAGETVAPMITRGLSALRASS